MSTPWRHGTRQRKFRDFHRQRYGNPLFPRAAGRLLRGNRSSLRRSSGGGPVPVRLIAGIVALALAAGAAWYVIWSPALRIASFEVQGASGPTEENVRKALEDYASGSTLIFPRRNILFFGEGAARKAIEKTIYLSGVDIGKKLPGTVIVTVREKTTKAALERDGRLYALDESGFVIRELSGKELSLMGDLPPGLEAVSVQGLGAESMDVAAPPAPAPAPPPAKAAPAKGKQEPAVPPKEPEKPAPKNAWPLILDKRTDDAHRDVSIPGSQAFSAATVGLVLQASARLPDVAGEPVRWFTPDETADSVDALMASGWHVYLATASPFDVQAERLSLVLKEKIGARRPALEYVDLRYNERIFFRLKDAAQ
ncbi:MAG TPA: hypothetical protein VL426_02680 [Candidatus Binatia bacterium]|nr:hypothetical protein [Candidatus Binatia bacterium]